MQGFKHLMSGKKPELPPDANPEMDAAGNDHAPTEASHVPAVEILNGKEPPAPKEPVSERRSAQTTRIHNGFASDLSSGAETPAETHPNADMLQEIRQFITRDAPAEAQPAPAPALEAPPHLTPEAVSPTIAPPDVPLQTPAPLARQAMLMETQYAAPKPAAPETRKHTRLIGFASEDAAPDPFAVAAAPVAQQEPRYPIGWLVVLQGPGQGMSFTLTAGLTTVGRAETQTVSLDFGDDSISREQHMAIAYDEDENTTFVGHGGKRNIVRLNGKPLLTTEKLCDGDHIKIGKTLLYFVALCSEDFAWKDAMGPAGSDG